MPRRTPSPEGAIQAHRSVPYEAFVVLNLVGLQKPPIFLLEARRPVEPLLLLDVLHDAVHLTGLSEKPP